MYYQARLVKELEARGLSREHMKERRGWPAFAGEHAQLYRTVMLPVTRLTAASL